MLRAEPLNKGRLPDPRLARDEHEPAHAGADVGKRLLERRNERSALEELLFGGDRHCRPSCYWRPLSSSRESTQVSARHRVYLAGARRVPIYCGAERAGSVSRRTRAGRRISPSRRVAIVPGVARPGEK